MVQCCICSSVFTENGKPKLSFTINDITIYGCSQCKKGNYISHGKTTLKDLKLSKFTDKKGNEYDDTGYLDYDRERTKKIENVPIEDIV